MDAGTYNYAIAFQERIKISDEKMDFYKDMAEMYVGDDVSPDFYGWVFPKYDHVGVGTGTVVNRPAIKDYQVIPGLKMDRTVQLWQLSRHAPLFSVVLIFNSVMFFGLHEGTRKVGAGCIWQL